LGSGGDEHGPANGDAAGRLAAFDDRLAVERDTERSLLGGRGERLDLTGVQVVDRRGVEHVRSHRGRGVGGYESVRDGSRGVAVQRVSVSVGQRRVREDDADDRRTGDECEREDERD
jgi:hypothetical protein